MKTILKCASALILLAELGCGQSPSQEATLTVAGKTISIKYSAPSVRGRQVFGDGGVVSHDKTYPVWRAGANRATAFHTDEDLNVGGHVVPAGDYTLFVLVKEPEAWQLIINKQTGQWGLTYKEDQDLARVPMDMSKPSAPVETLKYTLTNDEGNKALVKLTLQWDDHAGSVHMTLK
jgi:hypothetical protein